MTKLSEVYRMKLMPLTPIHVGTGDTMSPGEYFIVDDAIVAVNLGAIPDSEMGGLREELLSWIEQNPITWVSNVNKSEALKGLIRKHALFRCKASEKLLEGISRRWGKGQSGLEIALLHRNADSAFIPGSSIKGALRTALLWDRVGGKITHVPPSNRADRWERQRLAKNSDSSFGGIEDDLLRNLKVSDASMGRVYTAVFQPAHVGMSDEAKAQELQDYRECFAVSSREKPYFIRGTLAIETHLLGLRRMEGLLSRDGVLQACRAFYGEVLEHETGYWRDGKSPQDQKAAKRCEDIRQFAEQHKDAALIRLGWGCGMNTVGLNLAKPDGTHPPGRHDERYYYGPVTRVLISGAPPGWALFTLEEE